MQLIADSDIPLHKELYEKLVSSNEIRKGIKKNVIYTGIYDAMKFVKNILK